MSTLWRPPGGARAAADGILHKMFKKDAEYLEKNSPGLARKAMDIIF